MRKIDDLVKQVEEFEEQKKSWFKEIAHLEDMIEEANLRLDLIHDELEAELAKVNELNKGE